MAYIPFTYLIGWSNLNCYYYGVRTAANTSPTDLWRTYFTSSKHVKRIRTQYGEPDIITIRKTFMTKEQAYMWETKVLRRLKVKKSKKWLNISENAGYTGTPQKTGKPKNILTVRCTKTGKILNIHPNDPKFLSGEYEHPTKGTRTVFDTLNQKYCRISIDDNSPQYTSMNAGFVVVKDKSSNTFIRIPIDHFDETVHEYQKSYGPKNISEEQRANMSQRMQGANNPMFGKPGTFLGKSHSSESIEKMKNSLSKIDRSGANNNMFGKSAVKGRRWYNDGVDTFYLFPSDPLTANLHLGRLKFRTCRDSN